MEKMTVALAQICPDPGDLRANTEKMISYMESAAGCGAGLVVFPECSLTGYAPEMAAELAVTAGSCAEDAACDLGAGGASDCISEVEARAESLGTAVCFGYMEKAAEGCFITQELYHVSTRTVYRKTHPGSRESRYFKAGNSFPLAVSPVKTGIQLCWESHIPEISEAYRRQGAELLLFPYASGMSGEKCRENWQVHLPARASDNGCFAAACNLLTKNTAGLTRGGGLAVWDPKGRLIAGYFGTEEKLITAVIGGELPRDVFLREKQGLAAHDIHALSYFDLKRRELFGE